MALSLAGVQNSNALLLALEAIDISVPSRTNGRKTHHTETYVTCRLLSTLAIHDRLAFPLLEVTLRYPPHDRPDIFLHVGNTQVGIEITEAIPEQFAAFGALAEREFPDVFLPFDVLQANAGSLSPDQMRAILRSGTLGGGWAGDAPEREWALFMKNVVEIKLTKLAKKDFAKFDENWLAIYDNLPLPNVQLAKAIALLQPLLNAVWTMNPTFHSIFIESGPVITEITLNGSKHIVINDLWGEGSTRRITGSSGSCPTAWCRSGILSSVGCTVSRPFLAF